jgi:hypothetical protein
MDSMLYMFLAPKQVHRGLSSYVSAFLVRSSPRRSENDYFHWHSRCGLHTRDEPTAKPQIAT